MKEDLYCKVQQLSQVRNKCVYHAYYGYRCDVPWGYGREDMQEYFNWIEDVKRQEDDDVQESKLSFGVV